MKKFSVILSVLAAGAAVAGLAVAGVEYLKRKGYFTEDEDLDDEMDYDADITAPEEENEEPISFSNEEAEADEEMSFNEDASQEEVPEEK